MYAVVREPATGAEVTVCRGGGARYRQVYISEGHTLDLLVLADVISEQGVRFLLKYESMYCRVPLTLRPRQMRCDSKQVEGVVVPKLARIITLRLSYSQ